jgi:dolichol-phosphate mannosyltransferase
MTWRSYRQGFRMIEVPITFTEREIGVSKMSGNIFKEQLLRVTLWGVQARKESLLSLVGRKSR